MGSIGAQQAWAVFERADCLFDQAAVEAALARMAQAVTSELRDANPLFVCILNGGLMPFSCLLTRLPFPLQTDYIHATRYGSALTGGDLHWIAGPAVPPAERVVVLVDDILDEGLTLAAIETRYRAQGAKAVYKAVLAHKLRPRRTPIAAEFVGVDVPDRYVFGYGMDYKGYLRNVPGIYAAAAGDV